MKWELIKRLQLPGPSETSVEGSGTVRVTGGRIELTYSISDVNYGSLSDEERCLPVPDVENIPIKTPPDFINFDFEIKFSIGAYQTPRKWHETEHFVTTPKVHGNALKQLINLLDPLIQPHFEQIRTPSTLHPMGEITVCDLEFSGFFWPSASEMRYTLLLGRERLQRLIKDETIILFENE